MATKKTKKAETVTIAPLNLGSISIPIRGTAPYCQHAFSAKAMKMMLDNQMVSGAKSKKKKKPRNVEEDFNGAIHRSTEGWTGIPASSFRAAMISACRIAGFQMTKAKLSVFVKADGLDADSGQPLVKLIAEEPEVSKMAVRLESGVASIAIRPLWREWGAVVRVTFDRDQFGVNDVVNLAERAGHQVGIGEGRPDSRKSTGLGWGTFRVDTENLESLNA